MSLQDLLRESWTRDATITRSVVSGWGSELGIIHTDDTDALKRFALVRETDFSGLWTAIRAKHWTVENVRHVRTLYEYFDAGVPRERRTVVVSWHRSEEVPGNAVMFSQGDGWFAKRLNGHCSVLVNDVSTTLLIYRAIGIADANRIQVSEGTFVRMLSQARGDEVAPPFRSAAWKKLTAQGTFAAEVVC